MKKITSIFLKSVIIPSIIISNVTAQSINKNLVILTAKIDPDLVHHVLGTDNSDKTSLSTPDEDIKAAKKYLEVQKANFKLLKATFKSGRSFKKMYREVTYTQWGVNKETIIATFTKDQIKTDVVYNKKGNWIHTLSFYPADKTPNDVRLTVENDYPKYNITLTIKVEEGGLEFYIINLEDTATFKQIGVYNGTTNLIMEYNKSL